jgi:hypothetical protein
MRPEARLIRNLPRHRNPVGASRRPWRRSLDDDEAGSLQMLHKPFGHSDINRIRARNIGHSDCRTIPDERRLWASRYAPNFKYARNLKWLTLRHFRQKLCREVRNDVDCSIVD